MATNIPPHNLTEIVDAVALMIDRQIEGNDVDLRDLMEIVKGPDFPTGGIIYGAQGIAEAYASGQGPHPRPRALHRWSTTRTLAGPQIIITEIPYMVNKSTLMEEIAQLVKDKRIEGISDLRDESDKDGMRIVIELKRDAIEDVVLNQLFAHSQLQTTFGIINLALVNNQPRVLVAQGDARVPHRAQVRCRQEAHASTGFARRRSARTYSSGLMIALDHLDDVIRIIRKAKTRDEARVGADDQVPALGGADQGHPGDAAPEAHGDGDAGGQGRASMRPRS